MLCSRTNKWLFESLGHVLPTSVQAQCQHKVSQDFAFLHLSVNQRQTEVEALVLKSKVNLVEEASGFGGF